MTPSVVFAPQAARDIVSALDWSEDHFGQEARTRYAGLIAAAIEAVAADTTRAGVKLASPADPRLRLYHLRNVRSQHSPDAIRRPRHFIVFRVRDDGLDIVRVLHEAMDLQRHLSVEGDDSA